VDFEAHPVVLIALALTATNGNDDFQLVTLGQDNFPVLASGNDFTIKFDRNALAGKIKFADEFGHAQGGGELALLAVNAEGDHFVAPAKSSRILAREFTTRV